MKFWYKGHKYNSNIKYYLKSLLLEKPYLKPTVSMFATHIDDCCDYWTPIQLPDGSVNPKVKRAFMLDDDLKLDIKDKL